jgi:ADP-heptose:LPS heptosyltransferase
MGKTFPYIHKKSQNIYQSYFQHFGVEPGLLSIQNPTPSELKKILVLPESRKPSKSFKPLFIHQLTKSLLSKGLEVTTGFFKHAPLQTEGKVAVHVEFADLIDLIKNADLVVTADSLPAHLAQLLGKPHFVYYEANPNQEWTTPFCNLNKAYGVMGNLASLKTFINA